MNISQVGINLIKSFEGCRLTAYQDVAGTWTIGWGHTGNVNEGQTLTQQQADDLLINDLQRYVDGVNQNVHVSLNQYQFDSLVSFCYNVGVTAFATSTLVEMLNVGDYNGASNQFDLWVHASGRVIDGLVTRRTAEKVLFNKQVEVPSQATNTYTVQAGDNLTVIAQKFGTSVSNLVALNGIQNPDLIQIGQVLKVIGDIPTTQDYTIRTGENLTVIARRMGTSINTILGLNPAIKNPNVIYAGQVIKVPTR